MLTTYLRDRAKSGDKISFNGPLAYAWQVEHVQSALDVPLGFLVAVEDNSITELGNTFLRDNFAMAAGPASEPTWVQSAREQLGP